ERRRAEERPRVRDVLVLEEPPRAPGRERVVSEEKEASREGRGREQEEQGRRIEDSGLAIREPRLPRARQRIPERHPARAHPSGGVELERIEEVPRVPEGRRGAGDQGRPKPEDRGNEGRDRRDRGGEPTAEQHA